MSKSVRKAKSLRECPASLIFTTRLRPALGVRFINLCDRLDRDRSDVLRELAIKAMNSDDFVRAALGDDYNGEFVVDIDLPDQEASEMFLICQEKANATAQREAQGDPVD